MTMKLVAGVRFGDQFAMQLDIVESGGSFVITVDNDGVKYDVTVEDSRSRFAHVDISGIGDLGTAYSDLATQIQAALNNGSPSANTYSVVFDDTDTQKYVITRSGGAGTLTSITFNAAAQQFFGMGSGAIIPTAQVITSSVRCFFALTTAMGCKSNHSEVYEPDGVSEGGWTHAGAHFAISAQTAILFDDFDVMFEAKTAAYPRFAAAADPWTWHHFFDHLRAVEPYLVTDDLGSRVHYLRPAHAAFKPERAVANWDGGFHVKLRNFLVGYLGGQSGDPF